MFNQLQIVSQTWSGVSQEIYTFKHSTLTCTLSGLEVESCAWSCQSVWWPHSSALQWRRKSGSWHGKHSIRSLSFFPFPWVVDIKSFLQGFFSGRGGGDYFLTKIIPSHIKVCILLLLSIKVLLNLPVWKNIGEYAKANMRINIHGKKRTSLKLNMKGHII